MSATKGARVRRRSRRFRRLFAFAKIAPADSETSGGPRCALPRRESRQRIRERSTYGQTLREFALNRDAPVRMSGAGGRVALSGASRPEEVCASVDEGRRASAHVAGQESGARIDRGAGVRERGALRARSVVRCGEKNHVAPCFVRERRGEFARAGAGGARA